MRSSLIALVLIASFGVAAADPPAIPNPLVVATDPDPPFVIKDGDKWTGIAIELLRSAATELGTTVEFKQITAAEMTTGPLPDADLVAILNVSEKMNLRYELTHAFYSTGLAIAVPETKKESWFAVITRVFTGPFVAILIGVIVLLAVVGLLMHWVESRPIEQPSKEKQARSKALFWAFEPVIGYKASQHVTRAGRVIGTVWGLFGVVLVSGLTATLASQLTAHQLAPTVHGPDDLPRVRVAVVEHTAGVRYTDRHGIRRKTFLDVDQALAALERDEVDVVINDAPSLAYAGETAHPHIRVLPGTFLNHGYAYGMRPDAPYRHELNRALLKVTSDDAWRSLIAKYLGQAD